MDHLLKSKNLALHRRRQHTQVNCISTQASLGALRLETAKRPSRKRWPFLFMTFKVSRLPEHITGSERQQHFYFGVRTKLLNCDAADRPNPTIEPSLSKYCPSNRKGAAVPRKLVGWVGVDQ